MSNALDRFIPTGVGNTGSAHPGAPPLPVHPHGCGEHIPGQPGRVEDNGSSPRVWGTHTTALIM